MKYWTLSSMYFKISSLLCLDFSSQLFHFIDLHMKLLWTILLTLMKLLVLFHLLNIDPKLEMLTFLYFYILYSNSFYISIFFGIFLQLLHEKISISILINLYWYYNFSNHYFNSSCAHFPSLCTYSLIILISKCTIPYFTFLYIKLFRLYFPVLNFFLVKTYSLHLCIVLYYFKNKNQIEFDSNLLSDNKNIHRSVKYHTIS